MFFQDNIIYTDWKKDNFLSAVKEELGVTKSKVGLEEDHISVELRNKLLHHLQGATLTDVSQAVMRMRMIKSKEEISVLKVATFTFISRCLIITIIMIILNILCPAHTYTHTYARITYSNFLRITKANIFC